MASSGMLRRVDLLRSEVSEDLSASIIRVTRSSELETLPISRYPVVGGAKFLRNVGS
jgi:hypothetical protein